MKLKKYSKNVRDWYTKSFVFPTPPKEEVTISDGEPVPKKQKTNASPSTLTCQKCHVLKCSLSKLQNNLDLKIAECNDLHSHLDLQKESFEKQMKGALEKIF